MIKNWVFLKGKINNWKIKHEINQLGTKYNLIQLWFQVTFLQYNQTISFQLWQASDGFVSLVKYNCW
jgi:hypothetical protein